MLEILDFMVTMLALIAILWCWYVKKDDSKYQHMQYTKRYKIVSFLLDIYVIIIIIQFIFWVINQ